MEDGALVLGQRLPARFGSKWQNKKPDEKNGAHGNARVTHRFSFVGKDCAGEITEERWTQGRDEAADVVAEGGPGAAQGGGKEFWEINGVAAEKREKAKAHDRHHPENVGEIIQGPKNPGGAKHPSGKSQGESRSSTDALAEAAE